MGNIQRYTPVTLYPKAPVYNIFIIVDTVLKAMPHVTMAFNVAKIVPARASLTISLTKSLRVAGPLGRNEISNTKGNEVNNIAILPLWHA